VEKGPDAFRTISEVADDLDLPQHVLRFWETRFAQIRPMKRGGGRRYYRPDDVDLLRGIRHLLYEEGYTIHGVQRILRERGVRHVQAIGDAVERLRSQAETAPLETGEGARPAPGPSGLAGILDFLPNMRAPRSDPPELPRSLDVPLPDLRDDDLAPIPFRKAQAGDMDRMRPRSMTDDPSAGRLPVESVRVLREALQELSDCRRLLEAAREEKA
jgi:DNA-binding transcriptional MerR regulator